MIMNGNWGADVRGYKAYRGFGQFGDVVFEKGSRGEDVKLLQKYLTVAGYPLSADGVYGAATAKAVLDFQREYMSRGTRTNPDPVHDYVDQDTFAALVSRYQLSNATSIAPVPVMVMPEMTVEGHVPGKPLDTKTKLMIGGAVLVGLAGFLFLRGGGSSRAPAMAGHRKLRRKRRYGDNDTTKIWRRTRSGWIVERVVESDPRQQKRWLQIVREDEPDVTFKLSKNPPQ